MSTGSAHLAEHPDIVAMGARYERAAETPTAQASDALTVLSGLFVALSPWIVGFSDSAVAINNLVIGLAIAGLGAGYAFAYERTHRLTWVCPLLGVWIIIAHWVMSGVDATTGMLLSNIIGGAAVVVFGLAAMLPMMTARQAARR
ncbi:MAG: hypothetical protein GEV04_06030 [Actinophytocola sp.]|nr:hypothetical protein [Actinophytocola sp.]